MKTHKRMVSTEVDAMYDLIDKLERQIEWYRNFEESVSNDHRTYSYAVEYANGLAEDDIDYPFEEGDDYYTIELAPDNSKATIIWSCWDDQSEEYYNPLKEYFSTPDEAFASLGDCKIPKVELCATPPSTGRTHYEYDEQFNNYKKIDHGNH